MSHLDSLLLTLHIIFGATFAITVVLMQLGVGPAMGKISASPEKEAAQIAIRNRIGRAQDIAIIVMTVTALHMVHSRWPMIADNPLLMVKVTTGTIALIIANLMHFYFRGKKVALKTAGKTDEFKAMSKLTLNLEKVVLIAAPATFILAVIFNHF